MKNRLRHSSLLLVSGAFAAILLSRSTQDSYLWLAIAAILGSIALVDITYLLIPSIHDQVLDRLFNYANLLIPQSDKCFTVEHDVPTLQKKVELMILET